MYPVKRALAVLATAAVTAAAMVLTGPAASAESNGGVRVMPLGDSITDGFNVPGGYRIGLWQRFVAGGHTVDFVGSQFNGPASLGDHDHQGHSGWRIDQIDANVVNWLRATTPRTVLLHIGTNDMFGNASGAPARLSTLLDRITNTSPGIIVFVATIVPLPSADAAVRTYNAAIPGIVQSKVAAGKRVYLVDMFRALTASDLADGIHPNAGGYEKMAAVWYDALRSVPDSLSNGTPTSAPPTSTPPTSVPPTSVPPTSLPPTSVPPTGDACTATYRTIGTWSGGFQAEVSVRNNRTTTLNGWTVRTTLASGQSITNLWNGVNTGTSGAVSVRNAPYNGSLAAGGTTTFGFVATGNGALAPTGTTCTSP
ncbi:cellulose binding domain-containing protein [Phytohabitans houttuyneae]|uniref:SGNH hydrolase n=1 Tax=Phytohabitans houttuyneae TaxID=1076126 RepID=A0A6V8KK78_9ACTN|nr:cellulose binding domain-containing protein [Phytohabitans houttuyneae]GFJ82157.1 SGNH hydrolase [Phytohabitans houttuyneae]